MKTIIFYFSGTGNNLSIAKKIAEQLEETTLTSIRKAKNIPLDQYGRIGVIFPVYYFHSPGIVVDILKSMEYKNHQKVFLIASFGASRGYALSDLYQILSKKVSFIQAFPIKMPGNYILEYGAFPLFLQKSILKHAENKIQRIAEDIKQERTVLNLSPNLIARLFKNAGDGKDESFQKLGQQFYAGDTCSHCGICSRLCPVNNIKTEGNKIKWGEHCQQCMACIQWCPNNAIMHPKYRKNRKRYVNPNVSIKDFL